jgi:ATP-dependent Clp protease ATP-binding subunit ClpB
VLDDGRLTDGHGRTVDFKNTVLIMTSNIASERIREMAEKGSAEWEIEAHVNDVLKKSFRPEFLNRIDETIVFHPLSKENLKQIVDIQLGYVAKRLAEKSLTIDVDDKAKDFLLKEGWDPQWGARPLKRAIQQYIENPLAVKLLDGEFVEGDHISVSADRHELTFEKESDSK